MLTELPERGQVVAGPVGEPAADHARLQPEVQPRGHDRVVETGHHDDLVDELVVRAAPPPQLLAQRVSCSSVMSSTTRTSK